MGCIVAIVIWFVICVFIGTTITGGNSDANLTVSLVIFFAAPIIFGIYHMVKSSNNTSENSFPHKSGEGNKKTFQANQITPNNSALANNIAKVIVTYKEQCIKVSEKEKALAHAKIRSMLLKVAIVGFFNKTAPQQISILKSELLILENAKKKIYFELTCEENSAFQALAFAYQRWLKSGNFSHEGCPINSTYVAVNSEADIIHSSVSPIVLNFQGNIVLKVYPNVALAFNDNGVFLRDLELKQINIFISQYTKESTSRISDSEQIGSRWLHQRTNGLPDKRYSTNYQTYTYKFARTTVSFLGFSASFINGNYNVAIDFRDAFFALSSPKAQKSADQSSQSTAPHFADKDTVVTENISSSAEVNDSAKCAKRQLIKKLAYLLRLHAKELQETAVLSNTTENQHSLIVTTVAEFKIEDDASGQYQPLAISFRDKPSDLLADLFSEIREIKSYNSREESFYRQAKALEDAAYGDAEYVEFQQYWPIYSEMNQAQFKTYFSWRTKVRAGKIEIVSLSYIYLYIYELINNIGVGSSQNGLKMLFTLWGFCKENGLNVDGYMHEWIKDYYVCNDFSESFSEAISAYPLNNAFSFETADGTSVKKLALYDRFSSYHIKNSKFYNAETEKIMADCFEIIFAKMETLFAKFDLNFAAEIGGRYTSYTPWRPYKSAMYFPIQMSDKTTVIGSKEKYFLKNGRWRCKNRIEYDWQKADLLGYIVKRIEGDVRALTKYKNKLAPTSEKLISKFSYAEKGIQSLIQCIRDSRFDSIIDDTVSSYFSENNIRLFYGAISKKTCNIENDYSVLPAKVEIDPSKLEQIRLDSLEIQSRLLIDNPAETALDDPINATVFVKEIVTASAQPTLLNGDISHITETSDIRIDLAKLDKIRADSIETQSKLLVDTLPVAEANDGILPIKKVKEDQPAINHGTEESAQNEWQLLILGLSKVEQAVIKIILSGESTNLFLEKLAKSEDILLEVLMESINEKSLEIIGDSVIDASESPPCLYNDYEDDMRKYLTEVQNNGSRSS
ncbi:MAG: TerB N-terminal domain-containing protein [Christensenellaceae bacterium]